MANFQLPMGSLMDARRLYQQVANAIVSSILGGIYKPGERLPSERELAIEFKVGRTTIREAMIVLEIQGVAQCRHGSGVYVVDQPTATLVPQDLDIGALELTEARLPFEGESAALAATIITDKEVKEISPLLDAMVEENKCDAGGDGAERRFHIAVARATRNMAICAVVETLLDVRQRLPLCTYMLDRARPLGAALLIGEHRLILAALRKHDSTAARNAMRAHLIRLIESLIMATETDAIECARATAARTRLEYARRTSV